MKKRLLSILALTVALSAGPITAHAETSYYNGVAVATTDINPAVYELNYTSEEIAYLNTWNSTYAHAFELFLINNQAAKNVATDYLIDERCILQGVGIDMGDLAVAGMEAGKVESEIHYTLNVIKRGGAETASFYDICSPLTRYSNNVIVVELSERPYYKDIVEIRYDMNNNYVTHRVRENQNAVAEVIVPITKFPSENLAYTEKEMSILAEYKSFNDPGTWIAVDESGFCGVAAEEYFDPTNVDYNDNLLFNAYCLVKKRYGCDLSDYSSRNFYLVDTWSEGNMFMYSVRTAFIPGKEFVVYVDANLRCITMRGRDV